MQASPFDDMAAGYDSGFTHTACATALRGLVWERLRCLFAGRERILELGCGTGEDAIHLARLGHRVLATDASTEMIRVARLKALAAGCGDRIEFQVLPMESLHVLPRQENFAGVFSNFGAINCVADLPRLARILAGRLEPGAPLGFVAMGRHVPWEWLWYGLRGEPRKAFRRVRADGVAWRGATIRYPTPRQLARALRPAFTPARVSAVGALLPPSYASGWLNRRPRLLRAMLRAERKLTARRWAAAFADHYLFEAVRSGA
jgi:SAM-dependent methyltransferase